VRDVDRSPALRVPLGATVTASLPELLAVERIDRDLYRAAAPGGEPRRLFGGLVAAQALAAAGDTVESGRTPHSLHGYFLRGGNSATATVLRVDRDRDGRSFSARRVVALQEGEVIFNLSASFTSDRPGTDRAVTPAPAAEHPDELEPAVGWSKASALVETRLPGQPAPRAGLPTRLWLRTRDKLADEPLVHACALTYMSDISNGLAALVPAPWPGGTSLDHAVWFHRQFRVDEWVMMDLSPHSLVGARGLYTGTVHTVSGLLGASLAQESLLRDS
jgi:acyl-CoA thioesterase II